MRTMLALQLGVSCVLAMACMAAHAQGNLRDSGFDEGITARCMWGKSIAGMAQEKYLAGVSRKEFLVSLDQMHYARAWMPRMTQAIADNVYRSNSSSSVSIVQEQYLNDCRQYYLAK
ncbi:hypothetical protein [Pseudomonas typographi]|uniref:Valyl-tRNA synthetase n=1 Tax=Pseudomonas typographi TaxID=2715964 RepID=A0ABR7Z158_9PSED|nr:hypothetical protein [Pseudomonas typographi]MBD1552262.1 hypothetical protein [Pseudomonas typographi]MBD1587383.1 hypothetical protein [Pseudomonas typographi]MBD1599122.1 hypothetical protein [Pseudomonas typographi]